MMMCMHEITAVIRRLGSLRAVSILVGFRFNVTIAAWPSTSSRSFPCLSPPTGTGSLGFQRSTMMPKGSPCSRALVALLSGFLLVISSVTVVNGQFSSNVVNLTPKNWRQEVEESPHAVFVNICRQG
jgi:hypothetical protein